jgi:hypothetical protein
MNRMPESERVPDEPIFAEETASLVVDRIIVLRT